MGLIREPLDVDFVVDPRPLTKKEREAISKHIKEYKARRARAKKKLRSFSGKRKIATFKYKSVR